MLQLDMKNHETYGEDNRFQKQFSFAHSLRQREEKYEEINMSMNINVSRRKSMASLK